MSYGRDSGYGRGRGRSANGKFKQNVKVKVEQVGDRFATASLVI